MGLFLFAFCLLPCAFAFAAPILEPVTLERVTDGDTIRVITADGRGEKVRLFGVDCGELKDGTAYAFGAAYFVAAALESAEAVWLERDPDFPTDDYGRTLAWVWYLPGGAGGPAREPLLLDAELLARGLATVYPYCQSRLHDDVLFPGSGGNPAAGPPAGAAP